MLQQHSSLKTIKKKLIRKALDMIRKIADEDPDENDGKEKKGMSCRNCIQSWSRCLILYRIYLFKCNMNLSIVA